MSAAIGQTWFRLEDPRAHAPYGDVGRLGTRGSLMDEHTEAHLSLGVELVRLRSLWTDQVPRRVVGGRAVMDLQDPEVAELGLDFRQQAPDTWRALEVELLQDSAYRAAAAEMDDVERAQELRHDVVSAARGERDVPHGVCLRQEGGASALGSFVAFTTGVRLVDERFTEALTDAGLGSGWSTAPIPLFDRKRKPVSGLRLLVVPGRVVKDGFKGVARAGAADGTTARDTASGAVPALAGLVTSRHGLPSTVLASPAAAAALADAGLRGLALSEERWIVPLDS